MRMGEVGEEKKLYKQKRERWGGKGRGFYKNEKGEWF